MNQFIVRTVEEDKEFAMMVATYTIEHYKESTPKKEVRYAINSKEFKAQFPSLKYSTVKAWCAAEKIGKKGADGKYHVTFKEVENFLFKK